MTDAEKEWLGLPRGGARVVIKNTTHIVLDACILPTREWWTCCGIYTNADPVPTSQHVDCVLCILWE